jgi:hypothetical protein
MAFRVPTPNVSVVDLTARLSKGVSHVFIISFNLLKLNLLFRLNMKKFVLPLKKLPMVH